MTPVVVPGKSLRFPEYRSDNTFQITAGATVLQLVVSAGVREECEILYAADSGGSGLNSMKEQDDLAPNEEQALEGFKEALHVLLGSDLVSLRLFGSRARGEGTPESDLDVLVIIKEKNRALSRRIVEESLEVDLL
jgi:predicted nucleotidyltransferase